MSTGSIFHDIQITDKAPAVRLIEALEEAERRNELSRPQDKRDTGYKDANGKAICEGDILFNSFVYDFWIVVWNNEQYEAWLLPNSGAFLHPLDSTYPAHREFLSDVAESFEVFGSLEVVLR